MVISHRVNSGCGAGLYSTTFDPLLLAVGKSVIIKVQRIDLTRSVITNIGCVICRSALHVRAEEP